jgi:phage-related protein
VNESKIIYAEFYVNSSGNQPVREWLKSLSKSDRIKVAKEVRTVELGWPVGMPTCKPMGNGLYEVRTNLNESIARVLFCIDNGRMILLHALIKKSQKTPKQDLELALQRKRELAK